MAGSSWELAILKMAWTCGGEGAAGGSGAAAAAEQ
jgi:hypothetical protein